MEVIKQPSSSSWLHDCSSTTSAIFSISAYLSKTPFRPIFSRSAVVLLRRNQSTCQSLDQSECIQSASPMTFPNRSSFI
jgi:hypothetical protein